MLAFGSAGCHHNGAAQMSPAESEKVKMKKLILKFSAPSASGRREGWTKVFSSVDSTARGAKAFSGEYLRAGENSVKEGDLVVLVSPCGSVKNGWQEGEICRVVSGEDGFAVLESVSEEFDWRQEFLSLMNAAEALLEKSSETQSAEGNEQPELSPESWLMENCPDNVLAWLNEKGFFGGKE